MNGQELINLLRPVETGRVSSQIANRIKDAIRDGRLEVGDRLPSERELTEQLQVSRVTIRDAFRVLEARGLIEVRLGAHGGAFITAPAPGMVGEGITDMMVLSDLSPVEVTEARQVFELGVIRLVCERADVQDIADLQEICDRSDDALAAGNFDVALSAEFHVRLARATHNHAIELMTNALQGPLLSSLQRTKAIAPHMGDKGIHEHQQLVQAIRQGDADLAESVMREHLNRTARRLADATAKSQTDAAENVTDTAGTGT